jgi:energy-coupling factor transporter ATP-binding protein EcfA2
MKKQFSLERNKAILNFSSNYCDSSEKLINSKGFNRVLIKYLDHFKTNHAPAFHYLQGCCTNAKLEEHITHLFKLLLVLEIDDIKDLNPDYKSMFQENAHLVEFVEGLYNYWRKLERYTLVYNRYFGEGIQKTKFIESNALFSNLVLNTYRTINQKLRRQHHLVYRNLIAGANAGVILQKVQWNNLEDYKGLALAPFIEAIVLNPPFICYPKKNTRKGIFQEVKDNPVKDVRLSRDDWFCYPAKVGRSLAYIFFHKDFMSLGITLCNLFEIASIEACRNKKPDLIYVFGYHDEESKAVFFHDQQNDLMVGYASYDEEFDYFGYMKKMILTLHNVRMIEKGYLPIHGAMVNIRLKNGQEKNIVIIGDSGAGKSESLEALRLLGSNAIEEMKVIFDDMGTFVLEYDQIKAYGTEIGAFIRLDDLDIGYAYREIDRSVFMNPDKINARVVIPISDFDDIIKGYPIDLVLYANNYEDGAEIEIFKDLDKAIAVFRKGARVAKGTTSENGLVESFFANPFGPVQRQEQTDKLIHLYFKHIYDKNIPIGQIRTRLARDGYEHEGPRKAAEKLFEYISKEVI